MRRAFSMMMAITVMVIMMGISAMVFTLSNKVVAATSTQFQKEQAILLAKSYTEFTIMAITGNSGLTGGATCIDGVDGDISGVRIGTTAASTGVIDSGMGYRVSTRVSYIGNNITCTNARILDTNLTTNTSPNVIVDVYVEYRDSTFHRNGSAPWITYHRRTLQKI